MSHGFLKRILFLVLLATMLPAKTAHTPIRSNPLADAIKSKYNIDISKMQIKMMRPMNVISPTYKNKWKEVYQTAKKAQSTSDDAGVTDVNKLNTLIPVIVDPHTFGIRNVRGFYGFIRLANGQWQQFCVVKDNKNLDVIRHELSHATQDCKRDSFLVVSRGDYFSYLTRESEFGVRLAEMKRNYYQLTGIIVTNKTLDKMIIHFLKHTDKYSETVQWLQYVFDQASKEELMPMLMEYMRTNIDKLVQAPMSLKQLC